MLDTRDTRELLDLIKRYIVAIENANAIAARQLDWEMNRAQPEPLVIPYTIPPMNPMPWFYQPTLTRPDSVGDDPNLQPIITCENKESLTGMAGF